MKYTLNKYKQEIKSLGFKYNVNTIIALIAKDIFNNKPSEDEILDILDILLKANNELKSNEFGLKLDKLKREIFLY